MHTSRNKTFIWDDQLHTMELCMYNGIKVQVEGLNGEHIFQFCWCTGYQSWCGGDWQNDWVGVNQCSWMYYGMLNGCLPWHRQWLFKIKVLNEDGAFDEYRLALVFTTIPESTGHFHSISKFVYVCNAPVAIALQVFNNGKMVVSTWNSKDSY